MSPKPPDDPHIDLIVVVSGPDAAVRVNAQQKISQVIREALRESGTPLQRLEDWVISRESDGVALDHDARVGDLGLIDGTRLLLNPAAGGGG